MNVVLLMGVAGSGKTTIGKLLASQLGWTFLEGDDLHPPANRQKIESGIPLTDEDRWPWLNSIVLEVQNRINSGDRVVAACSALKKQYRELLRTASSEMLIVHLAGSKELIANRLQTRKGHFFPPHLLDSQLNTLENPARAYSADITKAPEVIVAEIVAAINGLNGSSGRN